MVVRGMAPERSETSESARNLVYGGYEDGQKLDFWSKIQLFRAPVEPKLYDLLELWNRTLWVQASHGDI